MIRTITQLVCYCSLVCVIVGCASGPKFKNVSAGFPAIPSGDGRIFFYRSSAVGAAVQPHIYVNDEAVGHSQPHGFFYIDRPAGNYVIKCSTEATHRLNITLESGETLYVATMISPGILVGQIWPVLQDEHEALKKLSSLSYTGKESPDAPENSSAKSAHGT